MKEPVSVVLAGIGGMGAVYLEALLSDPGRGRARIAGAADPYPELCPKIEAFKELRLPVYRDLREFYARHSAELAIVSSPHHFHSEQTIVALEHGSHVLCEKPSTVTIQDSRAMREAEGRAGKRVAVGYQWSFNPAFQSLKADILAGRFGRPLRVRCLYLWPRAFAYYGRNRWAGRRKDDAGAWVLDGPANNAMAHDLHNIFFLLGGSTETSALPIRVEGELFRAYAIENYDTAAARIRTEGGVEILFLVTHVPEEERGPVCRFEFERGEISIHGRTNPIRAKFADGTEAVYGIPDAELLRKLWLSVESVRTGAPPLCGLAAAESQVLAIDGLQDSAPDVSAIPPGLIHEKDEGAAARRLAVEGLDGILAGCFESWRLPSETGLPWARPGKSIDLSSYDRFPSLG
jgi:predicted dehydrogenase